MIERARAVHRHEARAEDREPHDLPSVSVVDGDYEQYDQSDDREHGAQNMREPIYGLAEGNSEFHALSAPKQ
jgi:hypothetical protein